MIKHMRLIFAFLLVFAWFGRWICVSPFPQSGELLDLNYAQLVEKLGPAAVLPDKFVAWENWRLVGSWVLDAHFAAPLEKNDRTGDVVRMFIIGLGSYSYKVSSEYVAGKPRTK